MLNKIVKFALIMKIIGRANRALLMAFVFAVGLLIYDGGFLEALLLGILVAGWVWQTYSQRLDRM